MKTILSILLLCGSFTVALPQSPDWTAVEKVFGRKGTVQGDVFKVTLPRSDLKIKVGDVAVEPALALTSWLAFKPMGGHDTGNRAMLMGDLVLLDSEIAPVMQRILTGGLQVTALHNHIVGEAPRVMYMHISGMGSPVEMAEAVKSALALTGTPMTPPPSPAGSVSPDWSKVEAALGRTGKRNGNVLQFSIPRAEKITENGMEIPPFMGMATVINFQISGDKAATTGDFVLLAEEVNPVIKMLSEGGIAVTAIHNHMLFESPWLFFVHFWGYDEPEKLAKGLHAALQKTNSSTN